MYVNEKDVIELCKRYGIEVIDKNHEEYYIEKDFSIEDIMSEPYVHTIAEKDVYSKEIELSVTMEEDSGFCNSIGDGYYACTVSKDLDYNGMTYIFADSSIIKVAA